MGRVISSLVVLPLWGWIRRQFDDRVALVACLLYVVQPKMIEWSPEIMRDQTFWFLFTLSIYWLYRAVTEVHYGYFLGTGAAITVASLARVEGLFLLIPLMFWTFWRLLALRTARRQLLTGAVLCVLVFPLLVLLINVGWVSSRSGWTSIYLSPLTRVRPWLEFVLGRDTGDGGDAPPLRVGRMIWVFIPTMTRGLAPVFALLMFGGIWGWRKRLAPPRPPDALLDLRGHHVRHLDPVMVRPHHLPPLCLADRVDGLAVCGAGPAGADGTPHADRPMAPWRPPQPLRRHGNGRGGRRGDQLRRCHDQQQQVFRGPPHRGGTRHWVPREYSTPPVVVGPMDITPIVSYYSHHCPYQTFRWEAGDETIMRIVAENHAGVVLLPPGKLLKPERCQALVGRMKALGLEPIVPPGLPPTTVELLILVRNPKTQHLTSAKSCATTDR